MKTKYLIASLCLASLTACDDGKPIIGQTTDYASPDGAYTATHEEVDNGLGFGQGALYDEVHVTRKGGPVGEHGNPGRSVVFYAESTYKPGNGVTLSWVTSRRLRIEYDPAQNPGKQLHQLGDVEIEFSKRLDDA